MNKETFDKMTKENQLLFVEGWANAILQSNEDLIEDAECEITAVRIKENGSFAIDYEWIAGWKETAPAYRDSDTGNFMGAEQEPVVEKSTFIIDLPSKNNTFEFHNDLCENVSYTEDYDDTDDSYDEDLARELRP